MLINRFLEGELVERNSPLPLVFIHINKTAGTTFSHMLFRLFDNGAISEPYRGDFSVMDVHNEDIRLFHGHMRYADWYRHGVPGLPICILRDPTERVISQYKSFKAARNVDEPKKWKDAESGAQALEIARNSTFDEFLLSDHKHIISHLDNLQVKFLSSSGMARDEDDLNSAIENLEKHFFYFGITERYEESMDLLSWQLACRPLPRVERKNVSESESIRAVSRKAKKALKEYVELDTKLYKAAVKLFEKRLKTYSSHVA